MAEQFKSITDVRKDLPQLSQAVQAGGDRFVITNQGRPQAVLLGYGEYKGLMAAVELLNRPRELARLEQGLQQTRKMSFEELKENLKVRKAAQDFAEAATVVEVTEAVPAGSIDRKPDQIREDLGLIVNRLDGFWSLDESGIDARRQGAFARKRRGARILRETAAGAPAGRSTKADDELLRQARERLSRLSAAAEITGKAGA